MAGSDFDNSFVKPATATDFTMPRHKAASLLVSASYRMKPGLVRIVGARRAMRACLNVAWLFKRFAFELAGEVYGPSFHNAALALSSDVLQRWIPKQGSVIDIGCGTGRWCRESAKYAKAVTGIDFSEISIATARARGPDNIEYIVGDVERQLGGRRFDVALMVHLLEHIDDPESLLRSVRGISGRLIIEVPDFESDVLNLVRHANGTRFDSDADHVREYTLDVLCQQLSRSGWQIVHSEQRGGSILAIAALSSAAE